MKNIKALVLGTSAALLAAGALMFSCSGHHAKTTAPPTTREAPLPTPWAQPQPPSAPKEISKDGVSKPKVEQTKPKATERPWYDRGPHGGPAKGIGNDAVKGSIALWKWLFPN